MRLIVAVDKNWAIGKDNKLMWSIPGDMKFFRETTKGNVIIMGRKTLESFPQGQPLGNRVNIVITRNPDYKVKGAVVVHSVEEALEEAAKHEGEPYVIGGESIYRAMLKYCDVARFLTRYGDVDRMLLTQILISLIWMQMRSGR